jgi:hypothetical protein
VHGNRVICGKPKYFFGNQSISARNRGSVWEGKVALWVAEDLWDAKDGNRVYLWKAEDLSSVWAEESLCSNECVSVGNKVHISVGS